MTEHAASAEERLEALERRMSLLLEGGSGAAEEDSSAEMNGFKTMILGGYRTCHLFHFPIPILMDSFS